MKRQNKNKFYILFVFALFINIAFWLYAKDIQTRWSNVPPVPEKSKATMMALSDKQLAYRAFGNMLQNIGSSGGRIVHIGDYNYERLKGWFLLQDYLDPISDVTPFLASRYYGVVKDNEKLDHVLDYLAVVGEKPYGNKWRWLAHGVYIARHIQKDNKRALELALILAANENPEMGIWARQMPAIILQSEGDVEEAYKIMINILQNSAEDIHPNEVNYMVDYICNTILKEDQSIPKPEFCDNVI